VERVQLFLKKRPSPTPRSESRPGASLFHSNQHSPAASHAQKSARPCHDFQNGRCSRGPHCKFSHVKASVVEETKAKRPFKLGECSSCGGKFPCTNPKCGKYRPPNKARGVVVEDVGDISCEESSDKSLECVDLEDLLVSHCKARSVRISPVEKPAALGATKSFR
jgi:hypothetical protein